MSMTEAEFVRQDIRNLRALVSELERRIKMLEDKVNGGIASTTDSLRSYGTQRTQG